MRLLRPRQREAVPDRQHHQLHPVVAQDMLVELLDGLGVGVRAGE